MAIYAHATKIVGKDTNILAACPSSNRLVQMGCKTFSRRICGFGTLNRKTALREQCSRILRHCGSGFFRQRERGNYKNVIAFIETKGLLGMSLSYMKVQETKCRARLESGQLWKIEHGHLYIVELGNSVIHYKIFRHPDQRTAATSLMRLEALVNFLRQSEAELVMGEQSLDRGHRASTSSPAAPNFQDVL